MRYSYSEEQKYKQGVSVRGIPCEFYDGRIDRATVPEGKFVYEVAGDDDSGGDPCRVKLSVMVNFFGTLVCDQELPLGEDGVMLLEDGDFRWESWLNDIW